MTERWHCRGDNCFFMLLEFGKLLRIFFVCFFFIFVVWECFWDGKFAKQYVCAPSLCHAVIFFFAFVASNTINAAGKQGGWVWRENPPDFFLCTKHNFVFIFLFYFSAKTSSFFLDFSECFQSSTIKKYGLFCSATGYDKTPQTPQCPETCPHGKPKAKPKATPGFGERICVEAHLIPGNCIWGDGAQHLAAGLRENSTVQELSLECALTEWLALEHAFHFDFARRI